MIKTRQIRLCHVYKWGVSVTCNKKYAPGYAPSICVSQILSSFLLRRSCSRSRNMSMSSPVKYLFLLLRLYLTSSILDSRFAEFLEFVNFFDGIEFRHKESIAHRTT